MDDALGTAAWEGYHDGKTEAIKKILTLKKMIIDEIDGIIKDLEED